MKPPAFQLYADDFLSGTVDMSNEEVGAYIRLLCHQWTKGGIPNDHQRISRMAGAIAGPSLGYVLAKFRTSEDGLLRNERLEEVRAERAKFAESQSSKGKKGAEARWGNGCGNASAMAVALHEQWPQNGSPSPSPSNTKCKLKSRDEPASVLDLGEESKAPKPPRPRDPLFDALAKADGSAPDQLTTPAARAIGVALANIKRACPGLTAEEINRRAQNYRRAWPNATLTASALSKNWAKFGDSQSNLSPVRLGENLI